ncbi:hypothetical protein D3C71_1609210 [compost metagenome]
MVGRTFRVVDRSPRHKCTTQICALTAVLTDDFLVDPIGKDETFGNNPQILQDLLNTVWDSYDINVILLQTHFFTHEQLDMDLVIFLKQRIYPPCNRGVLRRNVENHLFA